jgi:hypothetical protein
MTLKNELPQNINARLTNKVVKALGLANMMKTRLEIMLEIMQETTLQMLIHA